MLANLVPRGFGWLRDLPDPRDYRPGDEQTAPLLARLKRPRSRRGALPVSVDWREYFPPVDDQGSLASCSAHACVGLVQYFHRRATGERLEPSRLFLYKATRQLLGRRGDTGADLRSTLKALVRFGLPPEQYWPYDVARFDDDPPAFLYSFAEEFRSITYVRLDARGASGAETLTRVKSFLAAGFPCAFGFSVFSSISAEPDIPFPTVYDSLLGGQAAVALGYDDRRRIRSTKGALLLRNSWGTDWGEEGYGGTRRARTGTRGRGRRRRPGGNPASTRGR